MAVLTVYPDANPETSSVDGWVMRQATSESFSTLRNGSGTSSSDTQAGMYVQLLASTTTDEFKELRRGIFTFDTSALTSSATITGATLFLHVNSRITGLGDNYTHHLVSANPSSNTSLSASDYDITDFGTTSFASIAFDDIVTGDWTITLNASGLAHIEKTGVTKFGLILGWDKDNSFGGTWASGLYGAAAGRAFATADSLDPSQWPKLTITYTLPETADNQLVMII